MLLRRRSLLGDAVENKVLDLYPSTLPCFSISDLLSKDWSGPQLLLQRSNGDTLEVTFDSDGFAGQESNIETWETGEIKARRVYTSTGAYYEQTDYSLMPTIRESGASDFVRNSSGSGSKVCLKFDLGDYMEIASSTATFNVIHNGTKCSQYIKFKRDSGTTFGLMFVNRNAANEIGFFMFAGTSFSVAGRFQYRIESPAGQAFYSLDTAAADDVDHYVFSTVDITNSTASQKFTNYIDGTEYNTNTQSGTLTPTTLNATHNLTMGTSVTAFRFAGLINQGLFWHNDQSSNRADILSLI